MEWADHIARSDSCVDLMDWYFDHKCPIVNGGARCVPSDVCAVWYDIKRARMSGSHSTLRDEDKRIWAALRFIQYEGQDTYAVTMIGTIQIHKARALLGLVRNQISDRKSVV